MKKFLAIFLVLVLLFSFAACNKDDVNDDDGTTLGQDAEQTNDSSEATSKEEKTTYPPFENPNITEPVALFKVIDIDDYELKSNNPNTSPSSGVTFIAKRYEVKNSVENTVSNKVVMGTSSIALNETTIKDFVAQGWTITSKRDINTAVATGDDQSAVLQNSNGESIMVKAINKSDIDVSLGECVIIQVGINKDIKQENWTDYTVDGKTNTSSSTYADFVSAYGNPKTVNVSEYYKGNDYTHSKVTMIFEQTIGNQALTLTVAFNDVGGKATINSSIIEIK